MAEHERKPTKGFLAFWTTRRGLLTAAAVLLAAVGGTIALIVAPAGSNERPTHAEWVLEANQLCSKATRHLRHMPAVHISTYRTVVAAMARNERALAESLRALEAPAEDRPSIKQLTKLLFRQSNQVNAASVTYGLLGEGMTVYKSHVQRTARFDGEIESAARSLGSSACADSPVRTRYL
jgi:hypothetical protein